jgi:hypothetical protein
LLVRPDAIERNVFRRCRLGDVRSQRDLVFLFFFGSQVEPLAVCGTGVRDREAERKYLFLKERGESTIRKSPKDRDRSSISKEVSGEDRVGEG